MHEDVSSASRTTMAAGLRLGVGTPDVRTRPDVPRQQTMPGVWPEVRGLARVVRHAAAALMVSLMIAACAPSEEPAPTPTAVASGTATEQPSSGQVNTPDLSSPADVTVATALAPQVDIRDQPDGEVVSEVTAEAVLTVPDSTPLVFLVNQRDGDWLEVFLPVRPNGSTGWIHVDEVSLTRSDYRIEVSLDDFELKVWRSDALLLTAEVGIGREDRPTPGGIYFIRELLKPPDSQVAYGPYAYGLSGYSPVLDSFQGGDAVIGIHGTNEPDSFGQYVSSGCVRTPNAIVTRMVETLGIPLGTPVFITGSDSDDG